MNILFKALNDPTRREILELLKEKNLTAGEIADRFHISKPSISHHLDLLKQAGLVTSVKEGQYVYYSVNTTVLDEILKWIMQFKTGNKEYEKTLLYRFNGNSSLAADAFLSFICFFIITAKGAAAL